MCGIVLTLGTSGEHREEAKHIFKSLLVGNEIRGDHSTGVLSIDKASGKFSLFKGVIPSSEFLTRKKFKQTEGDIWIGHTRFATMGAKTERNAHPLQRGNVLLVHNGTISNHKELAQKYNIGHYEVDSEVLLPIVEAEDWDTLQTIDGNANFIAWDKVKGKIYVFRHNNPLFAMRIPRLGLDLWSSREDELEFIRTHYDAEDVRISEVRDDYLAVMDLEGNFLYDKKFDFPKAVNYSAPHGAYGRFGGERTLCIGCGKYVASELVDWNKEHKGWMCGTCEAQEEYWYERYGIKGKPVDQNPVDGELADDEQEEIDDDTPSFLKDVGKEARGESEKAKDVIKQANALVRGEAKAMKKTKRTRAELLNAGDDFCSVCSVDINADEYDNSMAGFHHPLCEHCQQDVDTTMQSALNNEQIIWNDPKKKPIRQIVEKLLAVIEAEEAY